MEEKRKGKINLALFSFFLRKGRKQKKERKKKEREERKRKKEERKKIWFPTTGP